MLDLLSGVVKAFVPLFVMVSPVGAVPLFLAMTANDAPERRRRTAHLAAMTATCTLSAAAVFGEAIFGFFGISIDSLRIAGGALLFILGLDMVQVRMSRMNTTEAEVQHGVSKEEVGVVPLGIPMLTGPGSIATTMVMVSDLEGGLGRWRGLAALLAAVLLVGLSALLLLRSAARLQRHLTPTVLGVITRLGGLLFAALAVQMMVSGIRGTFAAGISHPGL